jgi:hypothetical protein
MEKRDNVLTVENTHTFFKETFTRLALFVSPLGRDGGFDKGMFH